MADTRSYVYRADLNTRRLAVCTAAILAMAATRQGQSGAAVPVARIFREVAEHCRLMLNLEHLSDVIGPRLTGSEGLRRAAT